MSDYSISDLENRMAKSVESMKTEFSGLRTGRASPNLLDPISVDAYGAKTPINQVANISAADARMLTVQVFDASLTKAVEKAIRESTLGLNPAAEGTLIRVSLPELNEERRRELTKVANQYAEAAKVAVRHVRRDGMDALKKAEKDGDLGKDEARSESDNVQKLTDNSVAEIDKLLAAKEADIMQV